MSSRPSGAEITWGSSILRGLRETPQLGRSEGATASERGPRASPQAPERGARPGRVFAEKTQPQGSTQQAGSLGHSHAAHAATRRAGVPRTWSGGHRRPLEPESPHRSDDGMTGPPAASISHWPLCGVKVTVM